MTRLEARQKQSEITDIKRSLSGPSAGDKIAVECFLVPKPELENEVEMMGTRRTASGG